MFDPVLLAALSGTPFSPLSLFAAGEQGAWYDPSDFSTMFQDSAGTTPVTAFSQPVGLILDKSKGLAVGTERVTNGTFDTDTAGWTAIQSALSVDTQRLKVTNSGAQFGLATQSFATVVGKTYRVEADVTIGTAGPAYLRVGLTQTGFELFGLTIASSGKASGVFIATATTTYVHVLNTNANNGYNFYDNISVKEIAGNHAAQATPTARPVLQQDGSGFYHLTFDGVDDSLSTASIDFSATNKMTVHAGLRKLSDAAVGSVVELSANVNLNSGSFWVAAPVTVTGPNYYFVSRGTTAPSGSIAGGRASPTTNVITGLGDITAPNANIRVNASQVVTDATTQGTGNFGNYPLYIGSRGGVSAWLNGRIYSLIVRGASSTTDQINRTEAWTNGKTGAY